MIMGQNILPNMRHNNDIKRRVSQFRSRTIITFYILHDALLLVDVETDGALFSFDDFIPHAWVIWVNFVPF